MPSLIQSQVQNALLSGMTPDDFQLLRPHLEPFPLQLRVQLEYPNKTITHVHFIESGLASVMALAGDRQLEVGIVGKEGMTALAVVMGSEKGPHANFIQAPGQSYRAPASAIRHAMQQSPTLSALFINYAHYFMIQAAYTGLSAGQADVEERLSRWLLMSQDRLGDDLPLTHDFLALMLGIRRAGVTEALKALAARGFVEPGRGHIIVLDRAGMRAFVDELYGVPEAEYVRLTGCKSHSAG